MDLPYRLTATKNNNTYKIVNQLEIEGSHINAFQMGFYTSMVYQLWCLSLKRLFKKIQPFTMLLCN